jgi:putative ABC transport system permease protein
MHRIALRALFHDRGKAAAALGGIAFAAMMVLLQAGVYLGFVDSATGLITRIGGDVWVMPRGTKNLDGGEPLGPGVRTIVEAEPGVARARPVVIGVAPLRLRDGGSLYVQLVGVEPPPGALMPWSLARGLPADLRGPGRVSIDALNLAQYEIEGDPLGASLEVADRRVEVAAVTDGIRSFNLNPNMFAETGTAREVLGLAPDSAAYWALDLVDPARADDVARSIARRADLDAAPTERFRAAVEDYWVGASGAGATLAFNGVLGLVVGLVTVSQMLYVMTKDRLRELGTLKALGARGRELVGFVAWQAGLLALGGGALGLGMAAIVANAIAGMLAVRLSVGVIGLAAAAVALMCAVASAGSIYRVLGLEAAEVFK